VIFSAALIMCGTFGSMTRSGVATLIEIGVVVLVGLVLDIGLVMGVLVPALLNVIGPILHWPFFNRPLPPEEMAAPGS
jgi:Predicted drug exporters of the RND superfamily